MDLVSQNLLMTSGGKKDSTYVDDVFSTYLYKGNGGSQPIDNGLKLGNANTGNSVLFDDTDDYLQIAHTTDLCFGNGDFTIECWAYYRGDFDSFDALFGNWGSAGSYGYVLETVGSGATTDLEFYYYNDSNTFVGPIQGGTLSKDQWNHLCVCRSGNTIRLFVNGTMYGSGTSMNEGIRDGTTPFTIGGQVAGSGWWNGYISNLRVTKGQGLYTSNFTPSTQALTTTSQGATASNVKLLCCNKDTLTGATVTPSPIISDANYNGVPSNPIHSVFGPFTGTDGEGGMVWMKARGFTYSHVLYDTVRGTGTSKSLCSNESTIEGHNSAYANLTSFNNNGFSLGTTSNTNVLNGNTDEMASWSFRKSKGFFDIVTYTGNASSWNSGSQTLNHNLGCTPGLIIVKSLTQGGGPPYRDWYVWHRDISGNPIYLNYTNAAASNDPRYFNDPTNNPPTASTFQVGDNVSGGGSYGGPPGFGANENGQEYIAYLFAGGASTAATARSVVFDGNDSLTSANSSEYDFGSGDFTVEGWIKLNTLTMQRIIGVWGTGNTRSWGIQSENNTGKLEFYVSVDNGVTSTLVAVGGKLSIGQWYHFAAVRNGNTYKLFVNGTQVGSSTLTGTLYNNTSDGLTIGKYSDTTFGTTYDLRGSLSNIRVVKGTAVYTSSFRPPTETLTSITNTKLLCCNNSSTTGSTTTSGTITVSGDPTASTDSPFDDPEGFKFGEGGDQNLIKCGSYITDSNEDADVNLGWEPQWLLVKRTDSSTGGDWMIVDSMRGLPNAQAVEDSNGGSIILSPNLSASDNSTSRLGRTSTGFYADQYGANRSYIYVAIRRPDPLVGKPAEAGTDVFAMDMGDSNTGIPNFYSGFPVDYALMKQIASVSNIHSLSRLTRDKYLNTNQNVAEQGYSAFQWDSNEGWYDGNVHSSAFQSWMWKRYAGMDVVTYRGNGTAGHTLRHNLSKTPEMIWCKLRGGTEDWFVYHKGLNGGNSPENYAVKINLSNAEFDFDGAWNDTAPSSTTFTLGSDGGTNANNGEFIAMLFASVDGISSVGSYSPTSSSTTVTCGFQPRFVVVKARTKDNNWAFADSLRGITAGNDPALVLDQNWENDKYGSADWIDVSSTGFTVNSAGGAGTADANSNGETYIYYAHA